MGSTALNKRRCSVYACWVMAWKRRRKRRRRNLRGIALLISCMPELTILPQLVWILCTKLVSCSYPQSLGSPKPFNLVRQRPLWGFSPSEFQWDKSSLPHSNHSSLYPITPSRTLRRPVSTEELCPLPVLTIRAQQSVRAHPSWRIALSEPFPMPD